MIASELQSVLRASTGVDEPVSFACTGLTGKEAWFARALAQAVGLSYWQPDLKRYLDHLQLNLAAEAERVEDPDVGRAVPSRPLRGTAGGGLAEAVRSVKRAAPLVLAALLALGSVAIAVVSATTKAQARSTLDSALSLYEARLGVMRAEKALRVQRPELEPGPEAAWREISRALGYLLAASLCAYTLMNIGPVLVCWQRSPAGAAPTYKPQWPAIEMVRITDVPGSALRVLNTTRRVHESANVGPDDEHTLYFGAEPLVVTWRDLG